MSTMIDSSVWNPNIEKRIYNVLSFDMHIEEKIINEWMAFLTCNNSLENSMAKFPLFIKKFIQNKNPDEQYSCLKFLLSIPYADDYFIQYLLSEQSLIGIDETKYISYNTENVSKMTSHIKNSSLIDPFTCITVTMTSCKRINLFIETVNSFIACCTDLTKYIKEWLVVDDNSSEEDRNFMKTYYPFITFIFKSPEEKGHARSMNILMEKIKTPYVFHLEDDWRFFCPDNYIEKCLSILNQRENYGQCLLNRVYGEDRQTGVNIWCGFRRYIETGNIPLRYYIHEYATGNAKNKIEKEIGEMGFASCVYWPHYSLRVGLNKTSMLDKIGKYNLDATHFEQEYALRYLSQGYRTVFLDNIECIHIGRKTYERNDTGKLNAYNLNNTIQFGEVNKNKEENLEYNEDEEIRLDNISKTGNNSTFNSLEMNRVLLKTYVLNLKRRPDRLEKFLHKNSTSLLNYHIFPAIDGMKLRPSQRLQCLFQNNDYNYRRGLVGCALSHLAMWVELNNDANLHGMLVIEDDAILCNNFLHKFLHLLYHCPNADIIMLSHHPYPQYRNEECLNDSLFPQTERWSTERCKRESMGGTTAYFITKKGAVKLIQYINKHSIEVGIDWVIQRAADEMDVWYSTPFLAYADCCQGGKWSNNQEVIDTDIQNVYDGCGYANINDFLNDEIKYWNSKGVKNRFIELSVEEDENSNIVCRDNFTDAELMSSISLLHYQPDLIDRLKLIPVSWYLIGNYLLVIPDPLITAQSIQDKTFCGYVNMINPVGELVCAI